MAGYTYLNYAISTIAGGAGGSGTALGSGDTSLLLQTGDGSKFGSPSSGTPAYIQLGTLTGSHEICKVTNVTSDTLTIVRAQESTSASIWGVGTSVQGVVTAGMMGSLLPNDGGTLTTTGSGGFAKVASQTTAGTFGVPVVVAQAAAVSVTSTASQNILTYTPTVRGVYRVTMTFQVNGTGTPTVTGTVTFYDPYAAAGTTTTFYFNKAGTPAWTLMSAALTGANNATFYTSPITFEAGTTSNIVVAYQNSAATPADHVSVFIERLS